MVYSNSRTSRSQGSGRRQTCVVQAVSLVLDQMFIASYLWRLMRFAAEIIHVEEEDVE